MDQTEDVLIHIDTSKKKINFAERTRRHMSVEQSCSLYTHRIAISEKSESKICGFSPIITTNSESPPRIISLERPKIMASYWRSSRRKLMSHFSFQLNQIVYQTAQIGTQLWRTNDWLALDSRGQIKKSMSSTISNMCNMSDARNIEHSSHYEEDDDQKHRSSSQKHAHDLILFGCTNDGTSLTIHVHDFIPWVVYAFDESTRIRYGNDVDGINSYSRTIISQITQSIQSMGDTSSNLDISWHIEFREPSDGVVPSSQNPYQPCQHPFLYIQLEDASFFAKKTVESELYRYNIVRAEDIAMTPELRFSQLTQMCPTGWYTVNSWSECNSFVTSTQLEISCSYHDIMSCMEYDEQVVVMAPQTQAFIDIEARKDKSQSDDGISNPDNLLNSIIAINVVLNREGNLVPPSSEDALQRRVPRMSDFSNINHEKVDVTKLDVSNMLDMLNTGCIDIDDIPLLSEIPVDIPDPLYVKSKRANNKKTSIDTDYEDKLISDAKNYAHKDDEYIGNLDEDDLHEDEIISCDKKTDEIMSSKHDIELDAIIPIVDESKNIDIDSLKREAMMSIAASTSFGNMDSIDMESIDRLVSIAQIKKRGNVSVEETSNDPHLSMAKSSSSEEEDEDQLKSRSGFEIPSWTKEQLSARKDIHSHNNGLRIDEKKKRILTTDVLGNLKHIHRLCFFYNTTQEEPYRLFRIPALYCDDSLEIIVHSYSTEHQMLLAFRDFMVSIHPDLICGHFFRTYDWKTLFARANRIFNDQLPITNLTRDDPIDAEHKMYHSLPVIEQGFLSTKSSPIWSKLKKMVPSNYTRLDLVQTLSKKYANHSDFNNLKQSASELKRKRSRKSLFAFMDRMVFNPVSLNRKLTMSNNTGSTESTYPSLNGVDDVDSLVAVALSHDRLSSFSLKNLSGMFLNDSKMDIGIARMDECWNQKQYWPVIAYCDWDSVLCCALMTILNMRVGHVALSRCSYLSAGDIVNFGQQKRIYNKNAIVSHNASPGMVLVSSTVRAPTMFNGGFVSTPVGGVYPSCVSCLDFVSYYVTIIMEFNLCFTSYVKPWDSDFRAVNMDNMDGLGMTEEYRSFCGRMRTVYGPPDAKRMPQFMPYIQCQRCESLDYSLIPEDDFYVHLDVIDSDFGLKWLISKNNTINGKKFDMRVILRFVFDNKSYISEISECLKRGEETLGGFDISLLEESMRTHDTKSDRRRLICVAAGKMASYIISKLETHEQLNDRPDPDGKKRRLVPSGCKTCQSTPWLRDINPRFDNSILPDVSSKIDPYRESRYAADFDYLVPRSSAVTFQSDPEAQLMAEQKRYIPQHGNNAQHEEVSLQSYVHEDLLTEREEIFTAISPKEWANTRYRHSFVAFAEEMKSKQKKGKRGSPKSVLTTPSQTEAQKPENQYVPSIASFVLWRPGDFNNQAARDFLTRNASGQLCSSEDDITLAHDYVYSGKGDDALQFLEHYKSTRNIREFNVKTWSEFRDHNRRYRQSTELRALSKGQHYDISKYDFSFRRGIMKYGNNTGNVETLFVGRKAIRRRQAQLQKNKDYYDENTNTWKDPIMQNMYSALEQAQQKTKASANSYFGASGAPRSTSGLSNRFVAAAITFISRNYILFTTYITVTRWRPNTEMFDRILNIRQQTIAHSDKYTGVQAEFYKRYVAGAAFPLDAETGRQSWLKPVQSVPKMNGDLYESMFGIRTIYGDTDSIMPMTPGLVLGDPKHKLFEMDVVRRKLGIDWGTDAANNVTSHFRAHGMQWMTIEFEKMFWPFATPHNIKKKYLGGYWTDEFNKKFDLVRSWLLKRDIPQYLQKMRDQLVSAILSASDLSEVTHLFEERFEKMISACGRIEDFESDVLTYAKSQASKKNNYESEPVHVNANRKLQQQYPGTEHAVGERIEFVICAPNSDEAPGKSNIASRGYTTRHISKMMEDKCSELHRLRIDIGYYIETAQSAVRDVLRITQCPVPIYKQKSIFISPLSSMAKDYFMVRRPSEWQLIPPESNRDLLLYSARLARRELLELLGLLDSNEKMILNSSPMFSENLGSIPNELTYLHSSTFLRMREWYESEVVKWIESTWKTSINPETGTFSNSCTTQISSIGKTISRSNDDVWKVMMDAAWSKQNSENINIGADKNIEQSFDRRASKFIQQFVYRANLATRNDLQKTTVYRGSANVVHLFDQYMTTKKETTGGDCDNNKKRKRVTYDQQSAYKHTITSPHPP